jgi:hypothetical protein
MENIKIAYLCERQFTEIRAKGVNDTERRTRGLDDATGQYPLGLPSPKLMKPAMSNGGCKLSPARSSCKQSPDPPSRVFPQLWTANPFSELEVVQENVNNHESKAPFAPRY